MLWNHLSNIMNSHPEQLISQGEQILTYEEVLVQSKIISKDLKGERCCLICCKNELNTVISLFACFAAKVTAVPVSLRYGENHCKRVIEFIDPTCVITDTSGKFIIHRMINSHYGDYECPPAMIFCTSGTTGTPKGVMLSEKNILAGLENTLSYFPISAEDTILIPRPLSHCAVVICELLSAAVSFAKIELYSHSFNPIEIASILKKNKITVLGLTPTLARLVGRFMEKGSVLPNKLVISGECLTESTARYIREHFPFSDIYHVYGLTEASPRVCCLSPEMFDYRIGFVGKPLKNIEVKLIKEDGTEALPWENGEIYVKGDNVMLGYFKDSALTQRVLKDGWLKTGDIAYKDCNGNIMIKGRKDSMLIRGGMNIYPEEIAALLGMDQRLQRLEIEPETDPWGNLNLIFHLWGNFTDEKEVFRLCQVTLSSYQMPVKIILHQELKTTPFGKAVKTNA